jgi:uncharacterized protein YecE (DUF72 family)
MRVHVGTSGFSYKEWKDVFYPAGLPDAKMLRHYGGRFDTVEIHSSFYRMPRASVLEGWANDVAEDFSFVLKAPQRTSHMKELALIEDATAHFFDVARTLGRRLGPVLVALPPHFQRNVDTLRGFFKLVPEGVKIALEIGHPSWLDAATYDVLRAHDSALCAVAEAKKPAPLVATARWGYVRLREAAYTEGALEAWAHRIAAQGWEQAWVFFKHDDECTGPRLAERLKEIFARRL